jgi:thymidylate synthase (FAD)
MNVKLIWVTPDPEKTIAYIARVSSPSNQSNPNYAKLITYLIKNKHWSPLEHSVMSVEITTSRAIATQMIRHRSFNFQEFSQRYSEATDFEPVELRKQAIKNRQSSLEVFDPVLQTFEDDYEPYEYRASEGIEHYLEDAHAFYKELLEHGVAKEVARMVLPLTTQTTLYMTGSARSWLHYLDLRMDEHTQKEHRDIANSIAVLFAEHYPTVWEAYQHIKSEEQEMRKLYELLSQPRHS